MMPLPLNIDYLPQNIIEKARRELGETEEIQKESLEKFKSLIKEENVLRLLSDEDLLLFLRARKYDVERALVLLKNYAQIETSYKELNATFSPEQIFKSIQTGLFTSLPFRDDDGCLLVLFKVGAYNIKEFAYTDIFITAGNLIMACVVLYPITQICGVKILMDLRHLQLNQIMSIRMNVLRLSCLVVMNHMPVRVKGSYVLSDSIVISNLWKLLKPMFPKKFRERFHICGSETRAFHNYFSPNLLPEEFEGNANYDIKLNVEILTKFWNTELGKLFNGIKT